MEEIKISAELRQKTGGKGGLSRARAINMIPGVVYGEEKNPVSITISEKELIAIVKAGGNQIITMSSPDWTDTVILKTVQHHVVTNKLIHVDFQRISMKKKLDLLVPIKLVGDCVAAKSSGNILDHMIREVKVRCLPSDIPHEIQVDITNLDIGKGITLETVTPPKGVEILGEKSRMVVHLIVAKEEVVAVAPVAGEAATQPEVIAKGKKEEEGAEGAAGKDAKGDAKAAPAAKAEKK